MIDTNVISEARKGERADAGVLAWGCRLPRSNTVDSGFCHDRLLSLDSDAAQIWGRLRVPNPHNTIDKQIAAIALLHNLTVVTRNSEDFASCAVRLLNPFQGRSR